MVLVHAGCSSRPPDGASLYEFVGDAVSRNGVTGKPPDGAFPVSCERECKLIRALTARQDSLTDAFFVFFNKMQYFQLIIIKHLILLDNYFNFYAFLRPGSGRHGIDIKKPPRRNRKICHANHLEYNIFIKSTPGPAKENIRDNPLIKMPFPDPKQVLGMKVLQNAAHLYTA
ncbi:hypothetical protein [Desulfovibrio piger]|uniref:hypothetical protein n=1 Tax=Desulfovibrio piger TaxID=901 RepID=UPI00241FCE49|nr:hypothetical protein [Desulfovibrio piger]